MRRLKQAGVILGGPGKSPFRVAKQLGLEQRLWDSPAIDRHESVCPTPAGFVDRLCDQFLPRATLAIDQHTGIALRHQAHLAEHILHERTTREDGLTPVVIARPAAAIRGRTAQT